MQPRDVPLVLRRHAEELRTELQYSMRSASWVNCVTVWAVAR